MKKKATPPIPFPSKKTPLSYSLHPTPPEVLRGATPQKTEGEKSEKKRAGEKKQTKKQHPPASSIPLDGPILTPKQKNILDFMIQFREQKGYAPSQHEIAKHFGFKSLGTVQNYLVRLEKQGAINKTWNGKRSTQITSSLLPETKSNFIDPHASLTFLPLVGQVAAGHPIEAIENREMIGVPPSLVKGAGTYFILRVKGDSMIGDGILDGDFVIIKKQATAHNGQTVVALIENQATIKRLVQRKDRVELHAANPIYDPIVLDGETSQRKGFRIEGVLAGVIRRF